MKIVHLYGGMVLPDSFLCMHNLKGFYENGIRDNVPFVAEAINRSANLMEQKHKTLFIAHASELTYLLKSTILPNKSG